MKRNARRSGVSIIYMIALMTLLIGIGSYAVDYGRVQMAKTELMRAADAAARYACTGISDGTYIAKAIDAANDNTCDGTAVTLTSSDIVKGYYDTAAKTFTPNGTPTNAIKVTCDRVGANGIPMLFTGWLGVARANARTTVIAYAKPANLSGVTGLNSITMNNNAFIGSYNSAVTTNPTHANHNGNSGIGSNGAISAGSGGILSGNLILGPSGSNSGLTLTDGGTVINASTALVPLGDPAWTPSGNPGGVPQNYSVGSNTTLTGGTYWFTSLSISSNLSFSGPATLYINGNVDLQGELTAYQSIPANLKIYQIGSNRTFGNSSANDITIYAVIMAPNSAFSAKNNLKFYGSSVFKTIDVKNNADIYYDESLGSASGTPTVVMVK